MDHNFYSIVEKLAILEGRIAPKHEHIAESKQKKPALFNNLKKAEEDFTPGVGGVEFAEEKSDDVLSKVKASLVDYLKSAEDSLKQDKDLITKKKQDLDLKKKELKDLELQSKESVDEADQDPDAPYTPAPAKPFRNPPGFNKQGTGVGNKLAQQTRAELAKKKEQDVEEAIPDSLEEGQELRIGDPVEIIGDVQFSGATGEIVDFGQRSNFIIVNLYNHGTHSFNAANVEYNQYADDEDADEYGEHENELDEDPNQTPAQGEAPAGLTDPTYAESATAPVKTVNVPVEDVGIGSGGGGSVLVEIHGDERNGFCIKRAGKELPSRFSSLEECEIALEMYMARRKAKHDAEQSADYIEEK